MWWTNLLALFPINLWPSIVIHFFLQAFCISHDGETDKFQLNYNQTLLRICLATAIEYVQIGRFTRLQNFFRGRKIVLEIEYGIWGTAFSNLKCGGSRPKCINTVISHPLGRFKAMFRALWSRGSTVTGTKLWKGLVLVWIGFNRPLKYAKQYIDKLCKSYARTARF